MIDMRFDLVTGQMVCSATRVSLDERARYLADHYFMPKAIETLPIEELAGALGAAEQSGSADEWRSALLQLAHHRSERASAILAELEERVPRKLRDYWELAYAESVGWLGQEYIRDEAGVAHVLPAGTIFAVGDEEDAERQLN
jgi:hypothetical protein